MLSIIGIISQSFKMSIQNIFSNKMRSFLTMLGIIIGVASVIGLITIVKGATDSFLGEFNELGAGAITLNASGTSVKRGLTELEVEGLRNIEGVTKVSPGVDFGVSTVFNGEVYKKTTLNGEDFSFFEGKEIKQGRSFIPSEMTGDCNVCIVDETYLKKVLAGNNPIGAKIIINGYTYTVIGVMKNDSSMSGGFFDSSKSDGNVYTSYKNALNIQGTKNATSFTIYTDENVKTDVVQSRIRKYMKKVYNNNEDAFFIFAMDSLVESMEKMTNMMSGLLAGIASIALVVGGIGIMNMMLVSVSERTKEIGLRKALGAEPARIQLQFLIESIVLSLVGGAIGIVLGIGIAAIASVIMKVQFRLVASAIYIGVGFSIGVGVLFGWMPAKKASELNPIDALRSE